MAILSFTIEKIPDLALEKYRSLSDTGIDGVLRRHSDFLRQWHGIAMISNASFHLLYCFENNKSMGKRLKLYFFVQATKEKLELLRPLLLKSPLSDFYNLVQCEIPSIEFDAGTTLLKSERIAEIYNPLANKSQHVYFVPRWEMNQNARLYDLFRTLEVVGTSYEDASSCAYRVDIYPVSEVKNTISNLTPVIKNLRGDNDIALVKNSSNFKNDNYLKNICREYEEWMLNIETTPHFRINIFGFAKNSFQAKVILNAAASEALREGDFSIVPIKADENGLYNCLSRMEKGAESFCFYPESTALTSWPTTFLLEEVEPFFRFPVLSDGENIELPKETASIFQHDGIYIGKDQNGYDVNFPIGDLSKHAFFTGMPGSGKTNTMLHIVSQLKLKGIPFLIMEPAKKEYRALVCDEKMSDVFLFSPHMQSYFPLHMNPFEFPKGVRLNEHINALLEVFQGSFELLGPTYKFLSNSIQRAYSDLGWDIEDINDEGISLGYPSLKNVYDNLEREINDSSYDSEMKGNVKAFLQVRLGGLLERDAGDLFNVTVSTLKPEEWLEKSAIVELEVLGEQAKNFFVLLVCHYVLETLRVNPSSRKEIRHAIFIEEAHNIIASSTQQESTDAVNPKISATAYIVKMLAEVRALREAIVIADQLPTALTREVTKNTGLKIVHRLIAKDDREEIGAAISASSLQLEQIASYSQGKALIYYEKTLKPFQVQVAEWIKPQMQYDFSNDKILFENICNRMVVHKAIVCAFANKVKEVELLEGQYNELLKRYNEKTVHGYKERMEVTELLEVKAKYFRKVDRLKKLWKIEEETCKDEILITYLVFIEKKLKELHKKLEMFLATE